MSYVVGVIPVGDLTVGVVVILCIVSISADIVYYGMEALCCR